MSNKFQVIVRRPMEQELHTHMLLPEIKDDSKYLLCPMPGTLISCGKYYTAFWCTVLYCTVLYCTVLYCTVLYCTVLYCTVLHCTVLYKEVHCCCAVHWNTLYCIALYCIELYCTTLWKWNYICTLVAAYCVFCILYYVLCYLQCALKSHYILLLHTSSFCFGYSHYSHYN